MKILVVAATLFEVSELMLVTGGGEQVAGEQSNFVQLNNSVSVLVTGVGMVATAFALGQHLATRQYDLLLNLGIAGSFDRSLQLGEVAEVTTDTFSELGAEDDTRFVSIDELGFGESKFKATASLADYYTAEPLKQVSAITVNTVHGSTQSIQQLSERLDAHLESMEGAAFFYACRQYQVPGLQIRAVSNYVEKRNRDAWQIGPAIKNLNTFAIKFLSEL
jgi:futalosine hydrolase